MTIFPGLGLYDTIGLIAAAVILAAIAIDAYGRIER